MPKIQRILIVGSDSTYDQNVLEGAHAYFNRVGNFEYFLERRNNNKIRERVTAAIHQWKADGIIANIHDHVLDQLVRTSGIPAVNVGSGRRWSVPTVVSDGHAVGKLVAEHFLGNGFKNFAFCAKTTELYVQSRYEGFRQTVEKAGYDCQASVDRCKDHTEVDWFENRRQAGQWLGLLKKPIGIMCIHDSRGQEIAFTCHRLGLRVPVDVAIVSVGNVPTYCKICSPPLSSVDINFHRIGHESARLLHHLLRGGAAPAEPILVEPRELIVRQSSDIIAIEDPDIAAALRFIRDNADKLICVKDLLNNVPICRRRMERSFERLIGRTPKAEIMRVRLERAKNLLSSTNLAMPEVAQRAGFSGPKIFSISFHRMTGQTPSEYRRHCSFKENGFHTAVAGVAAMTR